MLLADGGQEVWCVWVTGAGESAISHTHVNSGSWSWVTLESPPPLTLPMDSALDPRQTYLDAIFKPGLFSVSDITKALTVRAHCYFFICMTIVNRTLLFLFIQLQLLFYGVNCYIFV